MSILLVWDEVGEATRFMEIEDTTDADYEKLKRFNGNYINSCDDDVAEEMNSYFFTSEGDFIVHGIEHIPPFELHDWTGVVIMCGFAS